MFKTALLFVDLEEEIYMECPQSMTNVGKDDCIILDKCILSLVQAANYKKTTKMLKKVGFIGGNADPCLNMKKGAKGIVYVGLYVDDNFIVGNPEAIDEVIETSQENGLVLMV